jgi:uncharacterized protein (TIGR00369 family)
MDLTLPDPVMSVDDLTVFLADAFPVARRPYDVVSVTAQGAVLRVPIGVEHERPGGTVSGPTLMGLADAAAWLATLSRIGPVALAVTSSLSINFLRKPEMVDVFAEAELLRLGRRQSVADVRMRSGAAGPLVAQATVTYAIPAEAQ